MKLEEVKKNIFFVEGMNKGRYPYSNSLLIEDEKVMLIDTGTGPEIIPEIAQEKNVDLVINSHGHEDHTCGNEYFPSASICAHQFDAPAIRSIEKLKELYDVSGTDLEDVLESFFQNVYELKDSRVDIEFEDGKIFDLGTTQIEVIHTPGHSAGHCCFYFPEHKLFYLSDIDLLSFGPWYGSLDSNINELVDSIHKIKKLDYDVAISSHKGIFEGKDEIHKKLDLYLEKITEREKKLLDLLQNAKNLDEIVEEAIIYENFPEPRDMFRLMEKTMIIKHLGKLAEENKINRNNQGFTLA